MSDVTVEISTKDRYFTTLPLAILSIVNQTYRPKALLIYDDGEQIDLRQHPTYTHLFTLLSEKGIEWKVNFGERKGQVYNHQKALKDAQTQWILRTDDDNVLEPNALEMLVSNISDGVGAIGGLILTPGSGVFEGSSKIEDIFTKPNAQWSRSSKKQEVDHFNNSFLFRKSATNGYPMNLSPVGNREESIFTYQIKCNGWKLILEPKAVTYHLRNPIGGIRSYTDKFYYDHDEEVFLNFLKERGLSNISPYYIVLNGGLGDHYVFKMALPKIKAAHPNKKIVLAVCYPDAFFDEPNVELISIAQAQALNINIEQHCIYTWMVKNNWTLPMQLAYETKYT